MAGFGARLTLFITVGVVVFLIAAGAVFFNSGADVQQGGDYLQVAATIFPLYDIVRNIAGDAVEVKLIVQPGASPHFYDFSPRQLEALQGTVRIFAIGHGVDDWVLRAQEAIVGSSVRVVDDGIALISSGRERGSKNDVAGSKDNYDSLDPHYWLNFENVIKISKTVAQELSLIDPTHRDIFSVNVRAYETVLREKNRELRERFAQLVNRNIVTFHDAWQYFAANFGLTIAGTFEPSTGEEPTPQHLTRLASAVETHRIRAIFTEPQISSAFFNNFAAQHGLAIITIDPIGGVDGRESYIKLMEYNTRAIIETLNGQ